MKSPDRFRFEALAPTNAFHSIETGRLENGNSFNVQIKYVFHMLAE
jgi:hypothetical protein